MQNNIEIFYPGFTKKSITFTIDDGNIECDTKFIEILSPAGILGTFNLCIPNRLTPEEYRELYRGYEIANHCAHHPELMRPECKYVVSDEPFDPLKSERYTVETPYIYKTNVEGAYRIHTRAVDTRPAGWVNIVDAETYLKFIDKGKTLLEEVFGKGSIKGFAWPYGQKHKGVLKDAVMAKGYNSVRATGGLEDKTNFDLPSDRSVWGYNASNKNLLSVMEKYENYSDDGRLKFFSFGVHSRDYDKDGGWDMLREFARRYGNRPEDYYYATVSDIFEYEDAVSELKITDTEVINPTDKEIYLKVSGEKRVLAPGIAIKI